MHHIYKTRAIILSSSSRKESDKQLNFLTEDFGLIKTVAQGVRKNESKLRFSIQDFSISNIAVVFGRSGWRLTNANLIYSIPSKIHNKQLLQIIIKSFNLVEKLVVAESDDKIFEVSLDSIDFIINNQTRILHKDQIDNLESVLVSKILANLGYFDQNQFGKSITSDFNLDLINSIDSKERAEINKVINQAIRESGL